MSWFDAASLTKFAKTALKEAQKTIDKALDIKEDEEEKDQESSVWGSFSGSYFEIPTKNQPKSLDLPEQAPLASPESELTPSERNSSGSSEHQVVIRTKQPTRAVDRLSVVSNDSELSKKSSESVEVLAHGSVSAMTSPEDSELPSISPSSPCQTSCTESVEVIDSLPSPSSVEVITDSNEDPNVAVSKEVPKPIDTSPDSVEVLEEETSLADSFTSISESTGTTMFSVFSHPLPDSVKIGESTPDLLKLSLPSQGSCDLLTASIQEDDWETSEIEEGKVVSPIRRFVSKKEGNLSTSQDSDSKTLVASCEGTLLSSCSSEETNVAEEKLSQSTTCMKDLIADAIGEFSTRETSPTLSEKSRSDLVKIGSEQTSGHTSGDELETTTSSDIEVISRHSPNGDSSSTTSRYSPAKMLGHRSGKLSLASVDILGKTGLIKGHRREPSEASSEDNFSEAEKLTKKITELTEILDSRETKLVELSKLNLELQEKNVSYKKQLEAIAKSDDSQKDQLIKELRDEGEKLSKTQLKQSTLIKTLRKQEQQQQATIQSYRKQIESLTEDFEMTKKKLSCREDQEKNQVENLSLLTAKVNRQDREIANLMDQLEKAVIKAEQLLLNIGTLEVELEKKRKQTARLESELKKAREESDLREKHVEKYKNLELIRNNLTGQIEELRFQMKQNEMRYSERESLMREEKKNLLRRLNEAESRNEELSQSVSASTRPLLRQLEVLQANLTSQRESWEKREKQLLDQLDETHAKLSDLSQKEKSWKQEVIELRSKLSSSEQQIKVFGNDMLAEKQENILLKNKLKKCEDAFEREKRLWEEEKVEFQNEVSRVNKELKNLLAALEAEKQRNASVTEVKEESDHSSPTLSFGRASFGESLSQLGEETFETSSIAGRFATVYDTVRISGSSFLENLQAQLKMREGEVSNLQWELQRRDQERAALRAELASLATQLEEQKAEVADCRQLAETLEALQKNYDALLQMHGEKVEEVEELRMDLEDVKEMYKAQIEQLLKKKEREKEF